MQRRRRFQAILKHAAAPPWSVARRVAIPRFGQLKLQVTFCSPEVSARRARVIRFHSAALPLRRKAISGGESLAPQLSMNSGTARAFLQSRPGHLILQGGIDGNGQRASHGPGVDNFDLRHAEGPGSAGRSTGNAGRSVAAATGARRWVHGARPLDFVGLQRIAAARLHDRARRDRSREAVPRRNRPARASGESARRPLWPSSARPAGHSPARSSARAIARRRRLPPRRRGGILPMHGKALAGPQVGGPAGLTSSQRTAPRAEGNSTCGPPAGTLNSSREMGTRGIARSRPEGRLPGCTVGRSVSSRRYSPGSAISRSKALPSASHSGCTGRSSSWAWPGSRLTSSRRKGIRTRPGTGAPRR